MPHIIHSDQTGFIIGHEANDNSLRAIQLIHWVCSCLEPTPYLILSTDAEKAFDQVDWSYPRVVLETLGLEYVSLNHSPVYRSKCPGQSQLTILPQVPDME